MRTWKSTHDHTLATNMGLIGSLTIRPKRLTNSIRMAMGLSLIRPREIYYYGKPDDHLKKTLGLN